MFLTRAIAIGLCLMVATANATYAVMNPRSNLDVSSKAIVDEYTKVYCLPDINHPREYQDSAAALLSRLTIKAGVGPIALAEFIKCKLWVLGGEPVIVNYKPRESHHATYKGPQ